MRKMHSYMLLVFLGTTILLLAASVGSHQTVTGKAAYADYSQQQPGIFRKITLADFPQPFASQSAFNQPKVIPRPENAWPKALPGFKVDLYATGLNYNRLIRTAPNGDLFLAESRGGEIKVFRGIDKDGKAQQAEVCRRSQDALRHCFLSSGA